VLFRSPVAGVFTSHFELQLNPPLPNAPPPALALRGVSTPLQADLVRVRVRVRVRIRVRVRVKG
jgi:hypothetical protein